MIFSKTPEDHVRHVEEILNRLRKHHFFLKMKKCEFLKSEIPFKDILSTRMIHNKRNRFNPSRGEFFEKKNGYLNWIEPGSYFHIFPGDARLFKAI
mgnify:CR=1 FL=1